jgi:mannose-6-phosphate isomerase-like protein (cupin superfamily)
MSAPAFDLLRTHLLLRPGGEAERIDLDDTFWPDVMAGRRSLDGRLLGAARLTQDLDHWEMHPRGDEVLLRLSGAFDVVLEQDGRRRVLELRADAPGCVVPQGAWHTILVREPGELLFMTAGEGTEHRPAR